MDLYFVSEALEILLYVATYHFNNATLMHKSFSANLISRDVSFCIFLSVVIYVRDRNAMCVLHTNIPTSLL